jgi:hypothetical protein
MNFGNQRWCMTGIGWLLHGACWTAPLYAVLGGVGEVRNSKGSSKKGHFTGGPLPWPAAGAEAGFQPLPRDPSAPRLAAEAELRIDGGPACARQGIDRSWKLRRADGPLQVRRVSGLQRRAPRQRPASRSSQPWPKPIRPFAIGSDVARTGRRGSRRTISAAYQQAENAD